MSGCYGLTGLRVLYCWTAPILPIAKIQRILLLTVPAHSNPWGYFPAGSSCCNAGCPTPIPTCVSSTPCFTSWRRTAGGAARVVDFTIFGLVLFSAVNLAIGNTKLEFFFISVFAAEYLIRLWCIVWHRNYRQGGWKSRLRYATTNAAAIIDFIAILADAGGDDRLRRGRSAADIPAGVAADNDRKALPGHAPDGTGDDAVGVAADQRAGDAGRVLAGGGLPDATRRKRNCPAATTTSSGPLANRCGPRW